MKVATPTSAAPISSRDRGSGATDQMSLPEARFELLVRAVIDSVESTERGDSMVMDAPSVTDGIDEAVSGLVVSRVPARLPSTSTSVNGVSLGCVVDSRRSTPRSSALARAAWELGIGLECPGFSRRSKAPVVRTANDIFMSLSLSRVHAKRGILEAR
jgi:hypothetical protein